jgi:hypothetical protein
VSESQIFADNALAGEAEEGVLAAMSARRLLLLGGIGLILTGMFFGDIFAVYTLHQNAAQVSANLAAAASAAVAGDRHVVMANFRNVDAFLENRGTKVDAHVHMIDLGYLALLLAILQPWVGFAENLKKRIAWVFLVGAWLLPVGVYLIHYIGLAHSPLKAIGWASIAADFGGLLVLLATLACLIGLGMRLRDESAGPADQLLNDRSTEGRMLFVGGLALVLLGFFHGSYYAAADLYKHEAQDYSLLAQMSAGAAAGARPVVNDALTAYGQLQGAKAVNIAAHAHSIEFGLLAIMMAFFQPYVSLRARWKRCWAAVLLLGSLLLPIFVLLEMKYGLVAGGVADFAGLLVIFALLAMWIGILRYTGELDSSLSFRSGSGRPL